MNVKTSIGQRIAAARIALGLSQIELSELTGFGKTRISNWETGFRTPKLDDSKILEKHLHLPAPYLLCLTDNKDHKAASTDFDRQKNHFKSIPIFNETELLNATHPFDGKKFDCKKYNPQNYLPLPKSQEKLLENGAFAFELYDDSMAPQLSKHDLIVFKPTEKARHNDQVLVKIIATNEILCRNYFLDNRYANQAPIKLIPNNNQWMTTTIDNPSELVILGVMSSMQRVFF